MKQQLKETVVIGWCDICAAGCRAVLGRNATHERLQLTSKNFDGCKIGSQIGLQDREASICISDQSNVSLIALGGILSTGAASHFVNEVLDKCRESKVKEIVAICAMQIKLKSSKDSEVYQIAVNCNEVKDIPLLPDNFLIKDPTLNTLIQFMQVERLPLRCFITHGYKITTGKPNDNDGSLQSIMNLQKILTSLYGIEFDAERTYLLEYSAKSPEEQPRNLMYL